MRPSNPEGKSQDIQQGSLFTERISGSGTTEPDQYAPKSHLEPAPEGVFPEQPRSAEATSQTVDKSLHAAVVSDRRHSAQVGKHSPLERDGKYAESLQVGDFLPGFGPVTYTNFNQAKEHAGGLDANRSQRGK